MEGDTHGGGPTEGDTRRGYTERDTYKEGHIQRRAHTGEKQMEGDTHGGGHIRRGIFIFQINAYKEGYTKRDKRTHGG